MQKDQAYHEAAIDYNEGLAESAEQLVDTLGHEEVQRWCRAVAKQHRFHAKRHQSALDKLLAQDAGDAPQTVPEVAEETSADVEQIPDGVDVPEAVDETSTDEEIDRRAREEFDVAHPAEADEGTTEIIEEAPPEDVLEDGCVKYHNPSNPNCSFAPEVKNA